MSRIQLTDNVSSAVAKMSDGNPGAMAAMMEIIQNGAKIDPDGFMGGFGCILSLDTHGIYGSDIYVLHSDICDRDLPKTLAVLRSVQLGFLPESTLKNACSRQDYSGKTMVPVEELYAKVKKELPNFNKN